MSKNNIIQIGNIRKGTKTFGNPQSGRIYSEYGIAPTLNTCQGGTITTNIGNDAIRNGYKLITTK